MPCGDWYGSGQNECPKEFVKQILFPPALKFCEGGGGPGGRGQHPCHKNILIQACRTGKQTKKEEPRRRYGT